MVFCKEENREFLQSLKTLVQRDREAGEYVPPNFDSILQSLDEMSAKNDGTFVKPCGVDVDVSTTYSPGRKEYEILQAYNSLIEAGGRPVCPLGDTYHVSKDPERYLEILVPWIGGGSISTSDRVLDWKDIFEQQLLNWQQFRAWQRAHRDGYQTHHRKQMSSTNPTNMSGGGGGGGSRSSKLEIHVESTRERLIHRGFNKSFCLNNDTEVQDDWTTWIEYLSFECYCLDDCSPHLMTAAAESSQNNPAQVFSSGLGEPEAKSALIESSNQRCDDARGAASLITAANAPRSHDTKRTECCSDNEKSSGKSWMNNSTTSKDKFTFTSPSQGYFERAIDDLAGKGSRPAKLHDAESHSLILRWAFLQEPDIAATCSRKSSIVSLTHNETETGATILTSELQRLKRRRDGSLSGLSTTFSNPPFDSKDIMTSDDLAELEHKRCRSRSFMT
ncbi:hypothetical protein E4U21_002291 [Claviceps maximensis]|nr:hypothetical protein E4U21_002291 [Claviceps maximensis]